MRSVWKFPLVTVEQRITAPGLNRLLCIANQGFGETYVWGEVDTEAEPRSAVVAIHGTGHPIGDDEHYIGTVHEPPIVWHYYATEPLP